MRSLPLNSLRAYFLALRINNLPETGKRQYETEDA
jgi:hypothetical protein